MESTRLGTRMLPIVRRSIGFNLRYNGPRRSRCAPGSAGSVGGRCVTLGPSPPSSTLEERCASSSCGHAWRRICTRPTACRTGTSGHPGAGGQQFPGRSTISLTLCAVAPGAGFVSHTIQFDRTTTPNSPPPISWYAMWRSSSFDSATSNRSSPRGEESFSQRRRPLNTHRADRGRV
jgi:hypothetical protein